MDNTAQVIDQKLTPISRGKRLKSVRMMTRLSRKKLEDTYDIKASTTQSWEDAKAGGLTTKGAQRFVDAMRHEGIHVTVQWLMYGIGKPPILTDESIDETSAVTAKIGDEDQAIAHELLAFRQHYPDAFDFQIADDTMEPQFQKGDYVAGPRYYGEDIRKLIGETVVVRTKANETLLRTLRAGSEAGRFTLIVTNIHTGSYELLHRNQTLQWAGPILWHRKPKRI